VQQRERRPCFAPGSAPESPAFVLPALSLPTSVLLLAYPRLVTGLMPRALGVARAPRGLDARRPAWRDGQQAAWPDRRRRGPTSNESTISLNSLGSRDRGTLSILMARMPGHPCQEFSDQHSTNTLSWDFVERVTRIELALSAWESDRSGPLESLTSYGRAPPVPVTDPSLPWLIAR
jgi:hypothetical protein